MYLTTPAWNPFILDQQTPSGVPDQNTFSIKYYVVVGNSLCWESINKT